MGHVVTGRGSARGTGRGEVLAGLLVVVLFAAVVLPPWWRASRPAAPSATPSVVVTPSRTSSSRTSSSRTASAIPATSTPSDAGSVAATVVRIVDGDTIVVNLAGRATTVRILNIDTPEVHKPGVAVECLGPEAAAALRALLPGGTAVGLTFDAQRTDRYGRTLAAVRVAGRDVGTTMAAQGWTAAVVVRGNSRFQMVVAQGQAEAMVAHRGLWNPAIACTLPGQVRSATAALAVPKGAATARPQQRAALTKQLAPAVASATALRASLLQPDDQQPVALRERYPATWRAQQARLLDDALRTARAAIG